MAARKKAKPGTRSKPGVKSGVKSGKPARVAETAPQPYRFGARETRISASEFKARCLELMDTVHDKHEQIVITKHGTPVAKLVPVDKEPHDIWGYLRGSVLWYGDLISPIDVEWDANK